jgi:hypothetical protein
MPLSGLSTERRFERMFDTLGYGWWDAASQ